jgi:hypothetical protein
MEMYRNAADRTVFIDLPVGPIGAEIDIKVYDGETLIYEATSATYLDGRYSCVLPFSVVTENRDIRINWSFEYLEGNETATYVGDTFVEVVTPLVTVEVARAELDIPSSISDEQIRLVERKVRQIIQTFTGQVFAPYTATKLATELVDGSIRLPSRMLSLTSVGGVQNSLYYVIADTGWRLAISYPRKRTGIRAGEVPITDPFAKFRHPQVQKITVNGRWGYERVPGDVVESALILMEQYLCPDSIYAERYLKTMTAADFRFEFDPGAYRGTGNVIVDQLLSKYWARNAAVV